MFGKYKSSKKKSHKRKSRNHRRGLVFVGGTIGDDFSKIIVDAIKTQIKHITDLKYSWGENKSLLDPIVTALNTLPPHAKMQFLNKRVWESILKNEEHFKTSPILYSIYITVLAIDNKEVKEVVLNIRRHLYDLVIAHIKELTLGTIKAERFLLYYQLLSDARDSLEMPFINMEREKQEGSAIEYM